MVSMLEDGISYLENLDLFASSEREHQAHSYTPRGIKQLMKHINEVKKQGICHISENPNLVTTFTGIHDQVNQQNGHLFSSPLFIIIFHLIQNLGKQ